MNTTQANNYSAEALREGITLSSNKRHTLRLSVEMFRVRIPVDPAQVSSWDDTFTLYGQGPSGDSKTVRTVRDDLVPGDANLDLEYPVKPEHSYTLEIDLGGDTEPYKVFEDQEFDTLMGGQ